MFTFDREAYKKRVEWFQHDRFGMFIHWGLYAIPARGEWVRSVERIKKEDYMPYFYEFDPVDYNPKEERYNWELVFCELYAGGKYNNDSGESYEYSLGLNGLGLCSTQYASEYMDVDLSLIHI